MAGPILQAELRARLDRFEGDMQRAGKLADNGVSEIENAFARANPHIDLANAVERAGKLAGGPAEQVGKTLGLLIGGSLVAALGAAFLLFEKLNGEMLDLEKSARRAGTTIEDFQRIAFAARSGGVASGQVAKDLEDLASKIAQMGRGETELSKLLDANNVKYKERGKVIIDTTKALEIAANLISRASSAADATEIARLFGLTRDWIEVLRTGVKPFEDMQQRANELGVVITKQTVEKAAQFQREWNQATNEWATFFQAKLAGLLPAVDDLINRMSGAAQQAGGGLLGVLGREWDKFITDLSQLGREALAAKGAYESLTKGIQDGSISLDNASKSWEQIKTIWEQMTKQAFDLTAGANGAVSAITRINEAFGALGGADVPLPRARPLGIENPTRIPGPTGGGSRDAFQREEDSLRKRIALREADTRTIGLNSEARDRARAVATLEEAAIRANTAAGMANTAVTEEQRAAIERIADQMEAAEARHRAMSTLFNDLRSFGADISNAFKEAIIQGKKFDEVLKNLLDRVASRAFDRLFEMLLFGGTGGSSGLLGSLLFGGGRAFGGSASAGRSYLIGERGPELFVPKSAGIIIPNDAIRGGGIGGTAITYAPVIDARGADSAAVARLERVIAEERRIFPSKVVAAVTEARRRSVRV